MVIAIQPTNSPSRERVLATLAAIQRWPHWSEIQLGAAKECGMSSEEFYALLPEYQRFISLYAGFTGIGMLSARVDQLWHAHILNTKRYQEFCDLFFGRMLHHLPCSSFVLYGISVSQINAECEIPETCVDPEPPSCTDPDPGPEPPATCYDPGDDEGKGSKEATKRSILASSQRFVLAYTACWGRAPSPDIWERVARPRLIEGVAI
ncbi:hypothetical protein KSF_095670 [Reticulibacter mediterranei]|uniref:Uncharacterized protein n=1 Tax=Reticulibacter mediterranei TaxID=2778369 RepID=A0A8J3N5W4_9CHLR|nr:hypothetical protein [Reticulibacter mediterranei]GHO99519.1 hypothetical protein KSF_095670 [Reticulibacter mediterranei]